MSTITFGIITDGNNPDYLKAVIESIHRKWAEDTNFRSGDRIVVVGGKSNVDASALWIPFDESIKPGWITKKKNIIAEHAKTDVLCLMHDYVALSKGWRTGFEQFELENHNWLTCTNEILNEDGKRYRDWAVIFNDAWMNPPIDDKKPPENVAGCLLQYTNNTMGRWQYYSGAYYVVQRHITTILPLDEDRVQGGGEDVQWCRKLYRYYGQSAFTFNKYSRTHFLKQKARAPWEAFSPI